MSGAEKLDGANTMLLAIVNEDGSAAVIVGDVMTEFATSSIEDGRHAIMMHAISTAQEREAAVRLHVTEPDGTWPLIVHADGDVEPDETEDEAASDRDVEGEIASETAEDAEAPGDALAPAEPETAAPAVTTEPSADPLATGVVTRSIPIIGGLYEEDDDDSDVVDDPSPEPPLRRRLRDAEEARPIGSAPAPKPAAAVAPPEAPAAEAAAAEVELAEAEPSEAPETAAPEAEPAEAPEAEGSKPGAETTPEVTAVSAPATEAEPVGASDASEAEPAAASAASDGEGPKSAEEATSEAAAVRGTTSDAETPEDAAGGPKRIRPAVKTATPETAAVNVAAETAAAPETSETSENTTVPETPEGAAEGTERIRSTASDTSEESGRIAPETPIDPETTPAAPTDPSSETAKEPAAEATRLPETEPAAEPVGAPGVDRSADAHHAAVEAEESTDTSDAESAHVVSAPEIEAGSDRTPEPDAAATPAQLSEAAADAAPDPSESAAPAPSESAVSADSEPASGPEIASSPETASGPEAVSEPAAASAPEVTAEPEPVAEPESVAPAEPQPAEAPATETAPAPLAVAPAPVPAPAPAPDAIRPPKPIRSSDEPAAAESAPGAPASVAAPAVPVPDASAPLHVSPQTPATRAQARPDKASRAARAKTAAPAKENPVTAPASQPAGDRRSFLAPDHAEEPATQGFRGLLTRVGLRMSPSAAERAERDDIHTVSQHWAGPRTIAVVNAKGGSGKTPTTILTSAVFARYGGAGVLAWDNNQTRGTLGWRTEQGPHDASLHELLPETDRLLGAQAQSADLAHFVHHQTRDRYDVLRSRPMLLADEQRIDSPDIDRIHQVAAKYYRLIVMDSGNDESDPMWRRMIDCADQIVLATTTRAEHAEAGALLLEALKERDERSAELAAGSVAVVSQADPHANAADVRGVVDGYRALTREVVAIPHDPAMAGGFLHYNALRPATRRAWLAATAAIARGL